MSYVNEDEERGRRLVKPAKRNSTVEKWKRWLMGTRLDLQDVYGNQAAFDALSAIFTNSEIPGSVILDYMATNYATSQAVAIRRLTDFDPQTNALGRLLLEIQGNVTILSRARYVAMFPWGQQHEGDRQFDQWAYEDPASHHDEVSDHLSAAVVTRDLEAIKRATANTRAYVDTRIAHSDRKPRAEVLPYADIKDAIATIGGVFTRYYCLITGDWILDLAPTPQYDVLAPFRVPWIRD